MGLIHKSFGLNSQKIQRHTVSDIQITYTIISDNPDLSDEDIYSKITESLFYR